MAQFHPAKVTRVERTTRDAVVVYLEPEDPQAFQFKPGQYLTFRRTIDGQDIRRSYSICAGAHDAALRVGVKRVPGGAFSTWVNDELEPGETIDVMPPAGNFTMATDEAAERHYLAVAAGSGITPVLSLMKTILADEPNARFTLIYGNRSVANMMFREEIEELKDRYLNRLSIIHMFSGGSDLPLFSGRIDAEKCDELFSTLIDVGSLDQAFICGPETMMHTVSDKLQEYGLEKSKIKFELFGAPQEGRLAKPRKTAGEDVATRTCSVSVILDGVRHETAIHDNQTSVLEAALAADLDAPHSCKAGVCSTCRAKVLQGDYELAANYALEDYELEQGFVLSCQCLPKSDHIVIDYDQ
jgi:ring-1,2-phenylacetyl-CoA epoxidase subunit PaaE